VGVTIHRVTAALDAGPHPRAGDHHARPGAGRRPDALYLQTLLEDTLRPIGVRLLQQVVGAIARGEAHERPQGPTDNPTFRFPRHHDGARAPASACAAARAEGAGAR
jgi:hypothetical protein